MNDKYLVIGNCKYCNKELSREYSINVLKGLEKLSDGYQLNFKCDCEEYSRGFTGNVYKKSVQIKQLIRENKLNKILR